MALLKVGDLVHIKSFMLESKDNPEGIDTGEVVYIERQAIHLEWMPTVGVRLDRGCPDEHRYMRFEFKELTKEEN